MAAQRDSLAVILTLQDAAKGHASGYCAMCWIDAYSTNNVGVTSCRY